VIGIIRQTTVISEEMVVWEIVINFAALGLWQIGYTHYERNEGELLCLLTKKALAVLLTLSLLLLTIPGFAEEKAAIFTVTFDLNTTPDTTDRRPNSHETVSGRISKAQGFMM